VVPRRCVVRQRTTRGGAAVCLTVVVLGCSCPATPGLVAAWRYRGRPVPPYRHGHAAVLLLQVRSPPSLYLVLPLRLAPDTAIPSLGDVTVPCCCYCWVMLAATAVLSAAAIVG
jgi:hypothetical protein